MNREKLLLATGCVALVAAVATAEAPPAAPQAAPAFAVPPFKNLQVFPKEISRADLLNNMKFFAQSLGVRCTHCHVGEEGRPLSTFDFASDARKEKQTARAMLKMVHKINAEEFGVKEFKDVKVTCYTCHRGARKPLTAPPPEPPKQAPSATKRGNS